MSARSSTKRKRQVNVDLTDARHEILMYFAEQTESISTKGPNQGDPSVGALVRRICEGKVRLIYEGKVVKIPLNLFFEIHVK